MNGGDGLPTRGHREQFGFVHGGRGFVNLHRCHVVGLTMVCRTRFVRARTNAVEMFAGIRVAHVDPPCNGSLNNTTLSVTRYAAESSQLSERRIPFLSNPSSRLRTMPRSESQGIPARRGSELVDAWPGGRRRGRHSRGMDVWPWRRR